MNHRIYALTFLCVCSLAIGCSKGPSTDELIGSAKSAAEDDQIKAVRLLQHRKGDAKKVVPVLVETLKDDHADIRWSSAIGLGYFGNAAKTAIPALEEAQSDSDARVRQAARVAIMRIQG